MNTLSYELKRIREEFLLPCSNYQTIIDAFCEDMKRKQTVKMLNTFVFWRDIIKSGNYLALDFGGSNIRVSLYEVYRNAVNLIASRKFALRGEDFDYTTNEYSLEDIFEMIVDKIEEIIDPKKTYFLGHTFSFAMESFSKNSAKALEFSKGFKLRDAIGKDINECLKDVIEKRGLKVIPCAVINDTTATLLSGFSINKTTNMACIIGTGHNMCFVDSTGEIINIESGSFNNEVINLTKYDISFLEEIPNERRFLLEALVGGKNLGKLANVVIRELSDKELIFPISNVTTKMLSESLENNIDGLDEYQNCVLREVASIIYKRAAYLVACEILGVLKYLGVTKGRYNVVFDGTVYEKTPYFVEALTKALKHLQPKDIKVTHMLAKDASSVGAVIACAMDD